MAMIYSMESQAGTSITNINCPPQILLGDQNGSQCRNYPPPPHENITKIVRPEYFYVIFRGGHGKIT